jgi:hypothetical protein
MKLYHALVVEGMNGGIALSAAFHTAEEARDAMHGWMNAHIAEFPDDNPDWNLFTITDPRDESYVWNGYIFELEASVASKALFVADLEKTIKKERRQKK